MPILSRSTGTKTGRPKQSRAPVLDVYICSYLYRYPRHGTILPGDDPKCGSELILQRTDYPTIIQPIRRD